MDLVGVLHEERRGGREAGAVGDEDRPFRVDVELHRPDGASMISSRVKRQPPANETATVDPVRRIPDQRRKVLVLPRHHHVPLRAWAVASADDVQPTIAVGNDRRQVADDRESAGAPGRRAACRILLVEAKIYVASNFARRFRAPRAGHAGSGPPLDPGVALLSTRCTERDEIAPNAGAAKRLLFDTSDERRAPISAAKGSWLVLRRRSSA